MYKDLQIQILEDITSFAPGWDFEAHFSVDATHSSVALVQRKRPEGLLQLVQQHAENDCSSTDVCMAMGMPPQQGNLTSIGLALSKLGWKKYKTLRKDGGTQWRWKKNG